MYTAVEIWPMGHVEVHVNGPLSFAAALGPQHCVPAPQKCVPDVPHSLEPEGTQTPRPHAWLEMHT